MKDQLYVLATLIAAAHNPDVHFDLIGMPEVERNVLISDLKDEMGLLMDTEMFDEYLERREK